jgi:hypothetical protein
MKWTWKNGKVILASIMGIAAVAQFSIVPTLASTSSANKASVAPISIPVSEVRTLPDGGKEYVYIVDGVKNVHPVPPLGFDPLVATDAQLRAYAFPKKPSEPTKLKHWQDMMKQWTRQTEPSRDLTVYPSTAGYDSTPSPGWTGYVANPSTGQAFNMVQSDYTQTYWSANNISNCQESSWVGFGGTGSAPLVQTGTALTSSTNITPFYEYLHSGGVGSRILMSGVGKVHGGDAMYAQVSYDSGTGKTTFFLEDATTHYSDQYYISDSSYYSGNSSEWIDERPQISTGSWTNLAQFDTVGGQYISWSNTGAQTSQSYGSISQLNTYDVFCYNSATGHTCAYAGTVNSSTQGFNDYWASFN